MCCELVQSSRRAVEVRFHILRCGCDPRIQVLNQACEGEKYGCCGELVSDWPGERAIGSTCTPDSSAPPLGEVRGRCSASAPSLPRAMNRVSYVH